MAHDFVPPSYDSLVPGNPAWDKGEVKRERARIEDASRASLYSADNARRIYLLPNNALDKFEINNSDANKSKTQMFEKNESCSTGRKIRKTVGLSFFQIFEILYRFLNNQSN